MVYATTLPRRRCSWGAIPACCSRDGCCSGGPPWRLSRAVVDGGGARVQRSAHQLPSGRLACSTGKARRRRGGEPRAGPCRRTHRCPSRGPASSWGCGPITAPERQRARETWPCARGWIWPRSTDPRPSCTSAAVAELVLQAARGVAAGTGQRLHRLSRSRATVRLRPRRGAAVRAGDGLVRWGMAHRARARSGTPIRREAEVLQGRPQLEDAHRPSYPDAASRAVGCGRSGP